MNEHLNLLPLATRKQMLLKTRLLAWSCVWAVALAVAVFLCSFTWMDHRALHRQAAEAAAARVPPEQLEQEVHQMQQQLTAMTSRESLLAELRDHHSAFQLIAAVSRSAREGKKIYVNNFELVSADRSLASSESARADTSTEGMAASEKAAPETGWLNLKGCAVDDLAIARFVAALRSAVGVTKVELKTTRRTLLLGQHVREYEVKCCLASDEDPT
jgi:hypothetical protein